MRTAPGGRRPAPRRTQAERRAETRGRLLAAARELFAAKGYAATGREEVAERAGVTRGALYHYFDSKADLFAAVVGGLDEELARRVLAATGGEAEPVDIIRAGAVAYIEACATGDVARIMVDAQSVLGAAEYRRLSSQSCLALLEDGLERAASDGVSPPGDPAVAAAMLLGALNEAAILVAGSAHPRVAEAVIGTVDGFITRLLPRP